MKKKWIIKAALLGVVAVAAMGAVVMWLWNWLIPTLFTGPEISYYQALGLMLLSRILFRGFVGGPKGKMSWTPIWRLERKMGKYGS